MPNDFAEDGSCPMSMELSGDEGGFDKALLKFYLNQKVKCLKRKLSSAGRRNVVSPPWLYVKFYLSKMLCNLFSL